MAPSYRPYAGGEERDAQRKNKKKKKAAGLWGGDPAEMKRRRRVAGYKAYAVEGKVKASIRRGLHWIKAKCAHIIRT